MLAARTAIEEGLFHHDKLVATIEDKDERQAIVRLLWSLFVLDRQFNYAAGLPHQLSDEDVDLPEAIDAPYLQAMVSYVKFGAQAWRSIVDRNALARGCAPPKDALDSLRFKVDQWRQ